MDGETVKPGEEQAVAQAWRTRGGGVDNETGEADGLSFRQRMSMARAKENLKNKVKEKVTAPVSMLKTKLLNLIPGYGPYVAFKQFISGKISKFNLVDVMIMLFSNLNACFMVLVALGLIALIVTWATDPLSAVKAIMNLGWSGVQALVDLFKGLL